MALRHTAKEVYRGYMPIDLPQHRPRNRIKPWWKVLGKPRVTIYPPQEEVEYSEEPEYPPLNDDTREGRKRQVRLDWYESLKSQPTAEAKLYEINRQCSHQTAVINNWLHSAHTLPMVKYLTQTHLIESLPKSYLSDVDSSQNDQLDGNSSTVMQKIVKDSILEQISLDKYGHMKANYVGFISRPLKNGDRNGHVTNSLVQNIVNQARKSLAAQNHELLDYKVDLSPAIRSWWYHSGMKPPNNKIFYKSRKDDEGNINQIIQMEGCSAVNFRGDKFLEPILGLDDDVVTDTSLVQKMSYPLKAYGASYQFRWPVALPGFWFEEVPKYDCPHTCFLSTACMQLRNRASANYAKPLDDLEDCLTGQAILTAFGWLNSLTMYHGFTPFQELDYPFTCQVVTTDGQNWLFNVYQLNSHTFHRDLGGAKRNNICWTSGVMKLYDRFDDGKFEGLNEDVLELLTRFLSKQTSQTYMDKLNLRPYLCEDGRTEEQKGETRKKLRDTFEQRYNRWLAHDWKIPEYEHIWFRAPETRHQITHMKPKWRIPRPKYPKIFE